MYRDLVYSVSIQATLMEEEKLYYVQSSVSFSAVLEQHPKKNNPCLCAGYVLTNGQPLPIGVL